MISVLLSPPSSVPTSSSSVVGSPPAASRRALSPLPLPKNGSLPAAESASISTYTRSIRQQASPTCTNPTDQATRTHRALLFFLDRRCLPRNLQRNLPLPFPPRSLTKPCRSLAPQYPQLLRTKSDTCQRASSPTSHTAQAAHTSSTRASACIEWHSELPEAHQHPHNRHDEEDARAQ